MQHNNRHRQIKRINKKHPNLAALVAGAAIMASTLLPGISGLPAQAAANPDTNNNTVVTEQSHHVNPTTHAAAAARIANSQKPSNNHPPDDFKQVLNIKATAYAPGPMTMISGVIKPS